jgi:hypothetical protein
METRKEHERFHNTKASAGRIRCTLAMVDWARAVRKRSEEDTGFLTDSGLRHRLNALAIAGTDQPRHVEWTHLPPRLVTQPSQKRLEKASKLFLPIRR